MLLGNPYSAYATVPAHHDLAALASYFLRHPDIQTLILALG
jgi:hypothetical protein